MSSSPQSGQGKNISPCSTVTDDHLNDSSINARQSVISTYKREYKCKIFEQIPEVLS